MTVIASKVEYPKISGTASTFAGNVTRKLRAQGYAVARARGKADDKAQVWVEATNEQHCGLPTARIILTFEELSKPQPRKANNHRVPIMPGWVQLMKDLGYHVVETRGAILIVAAKEVRIVEVPSSERTNPDYPVRLENGEPVMCGCKGFAFRLACRHLAVAKTLATKPKKSVASVG